MAEKKKRYLVKGSLLCGLLASNAVSLCWFCASKKAREIGIALVLLSAVAGLMWFGNLLLLQKAGKVRKIISLMLISVLNFCAYFSVSVYFLLPTQLFYPRFDKQAYNELQAVPNAEEVSIYTSDGMLYGWFLKNHEGRTPLIIYYGGNGENSSERIGKLPEQALYKMVNYCNIVMIDYPGYGKSDGKPSDDSIRSAALAAFDTMKKRDDVDSNKIILVGYSLGTGAANYVASRRDIAGLVLMAPYADGLDLVNRFLPIFYGPLKNLVSYKMPAAEYAAAVKVKPLIFASPDDETVSYCSSLKLAEKYEDCIFITCDGLKHNDFHNDEMIAGRTAEYIKETTDNG